MRRLIPFLILVLLIAPEAMAGCAPEKMVRITFSNTTPSVKAGTFAALPRTILRLGAHYGRLEEAPDTGHGIHGLIVTNQRDTWMVNLALMSGRHIVDEAESYDFHAPIVGGRDTPFPGFEFGCELAWMEGQGVEAVPVTVDGNRLLRYEASAGGFTVALLVDPPTRIPRGLEVTRGGELVYRLRYDEYLTGLEPDTTLFARPAGITWEKAE
jgi:hypothetical protein